MSRNFNWNNIISINNTQQNGFEELICQLARTQEEYKDSTFTKVGNPDAGVECYYTFENGDEIGYQAKYFTSSLATSEWNQIEKSVQTAIEKHPKLVKYYIAVPIDRADARIFNKKSFKDKWDEKVTDWKKFATSKGISKIEFEYWGSSELIDLLKKDSNAGLKKFFLGELELSDKWLSQKNQEAIINLGPRYTQEVNVDSDLVKYFDAIGRTNKFQEKAERYLHELLLTYRGVKSLYDNQQSIEQLIQSISNEFYSIKFNNISEIDTSRLEESLNKLIRTLQETIDQLNANNEINNEEERNKRREQIKELRRLRDQASEFKHFIQSDEMSLAKSGVMILSGSAGIGKSHTLADIIGKREKDQLRSILLLGQHFKTNHSPWSQIINDLLRIQNCNEDEFLSALNAKAECGENSKRILLVIDAINEGNGRWFWHDHLLGFVNSIKRYRSLGLILSIRESYHELMIPNELYENNLAIHITHDGFANNQYNATQKFFEYYKIQQPSIPIMHQEFNNPLFLKLFCESLNKRGLTTIPTGYNGISSIIAHYVGAIEHQLSATWVNIRDLKIIYKIIEIVSRLTIENQLITYEVAYEKVEELAARFRLEPGLLDAIISVGLLSKNYHYKLEDEVIYFSYERFGDHLVVKYLLDNYFDANNPIFSFNNSPFLSRYFNIWNYVGVIEALSIQIPEKTRAEFSILLPEKLANDRVIYDSFISSLAWRDVSSINQNTIDYINRNLHNTYFFVELIKQLYTIVSRVDHPLNGYFVNDLLFEHSMSERDSWWNFIINEITCNYSNANDPIQRLIDWSLSQEDKKYVSDESIFLTAIGLTWLLATSNRKIRDLSTKSLITLLINREEVLLRLLNFFSEINDPYIKERLYAVTYGCVLRSNFRNKDGLINICLFIYENVFNVEEVYPHILLRDYAKGIIDYAYYKQLPLSTQIDINKIKPPYKSSLPNIASYSDDSKINKYLEVDNYSQKRIIYSMTTENGDRKGYGYGDFGRYVLGSALYDFDCKKDEQALSNYAAIKIFEEYGYDYKLLNDVEEQISKINNYYRLDYQIERIGKKYQWIAFYDLMARVTDNCKIYADSYSKYKTETKYIGTFEPYIRDIDPTILIRKTKATGIPLSQQWWNIECHSKWDMKGNNWIISSEDLPDLSNLIQQKDGNGTNWIVLESYPEWHEKLPIGQEKYHTKHKSIWYQLRSYLIPQEKLSTFKKWAEAQNFYGRWMPESHHNFQMFYRESYWSTAHEYFYGDENSYSLEDRGYSGDLILTTENYFWEEEFDYSKDETLNILKPCKRLYSGLNMTFSNEKDGEFVDADGNLICFDASVQNESYSCLLIKKDDLLTFLEKEQLTMVWVNIGEKQAFGESAYALMGDITQYAWLDKGKIETSEITITTQSIES